MSAKRKPGRKPTRARNKRGRPAGGRGRTTSSAPEEARRATAKRRARASELIALGYRAVDAIENLALEFDVDSTTAEADVQHILAMWEAMAGAPPTEVRAQAIALGYTLLREARALGDYRTSASIYATLARVTGAMAPPRLGIGGGVVIPPPQAGNGPEDTAAAAINRAEAMMAGRTSGGHRARIAELLDRADRKRLDASHPAGPRVIDVPSPDLVVMPADKADGAA